VSIEEQNARNSIVVEALHAVVEQQSESTIVSIASTVRSLASARRRSYSASSLRSDVLRHDMLDRLTNYRSDVADPLVTIAQRVLLRLGARRLVPSQRSLAPSKPNTGVAMKLGSAARCAVTIVSLLTLASCLRHHTATTTTRTVRTDATTPASLPPEATACQTVADCDRIPMPAESERNGGFCCNVCGGYLAVNRAWQARQPVCDSSTRGACPVSCAEAMPPPVACEAGRCVLTYPPVQTACHADHECVAVPRLLPDARSNGTCRIACGEFVVGNREWQAWSAVLWENASVVGQCAPECARSLAGAMCVSGQCVARPIRTYRVNHMDLRAPSTVGSLDAASVARVVGANVTRFAACEERPRAIDPIGYEGFRMQFVIGADGRATEIDAGEVAYHLPDIASCMVRVIQGLQFDRPDGGASVRVDYPMGVAFDAR
jgi:hypothetical protein